jgi:hypothetical protein
LLPFNYSKEIKMLNDEHGNIYLARHKWNERAAEEKKTHRISSILDRS